MITSPPLTIDPWLTDPFWSPPLPSGDYVRVSIADRGGGIAKEVLTSFHIHFPALRKWFGDQKTSVQKALPRLGDAFLM